MGRRLDDAIDAWRRGTTGAPRNSWGSFARGDQMLYAALFRGRAGTLLGLLCAAALVALLVLLFH